jgi:hypothetical protein
MKRKILFIAALMIILNYFSFSTNNGDVLTDPNEIIIKPKAVNGYLMFMVKYTSDDFKQLVYNAIKNGTGSHRFKERGINLENIFYHLGTWEWMGGAHDGHLPVNYYNESMSITIKNIESKQVFNVLIFPFMRRAFVPNITVGKYKFEKLTLTISLGGANVFNSYIMVDKNLPEFTISNNTAFIYGLINLKGGEINLSNDEKSMTKLKKYLGLMMKFNKNLKVVELDPANYIKKDDTNIGSDSNKPRSDKMMILNLLKEGKITPEEAEKLLNALKQ